MKRQTYTIDATDRPLGRLATEIVILLRGKNRPDFAPHKDEGAFVIIRNANKVKFTGKKLQQKVYYRHSGYPGGLKEKPLKKLFSQRPSEALRKAVFGMLPKNKLRAKQLNRLSFTPLERAVGPF